MSETKHARHTVDSVGERLQLFHAEFSSFAKRAEAKTDEGLVWWRKSHWSALIGLVVVIAAVAFGAWLF